MERPEPTARTGGAPGEAHKMTETRRKQKDPKKGQEPPHGIRREVPASFLDPLIPLVLLFPAASQVRGQVLRYRSESEPLPGLRAVEAGLVSRRGSQDGPLEALQSPLETRGRDAELLGHGVGQDLVSAGSHHGFQRLLLVHGELAPDLVGEPFHVEGPRRRCRECAPPTSASGSKPGSRKARSMTSRKSSLGTGPRKRRSPRR